MKRETTLSTVKGIAMAGIVDWMYHRKG